MRDDFPIATKEVLAKRVAHRCSNPGCRQVTSGPQQEPTKAVNIGVAAHITAASEGGPRFDASLTPEQRRSADNGVWLCQNCGKLVDNDPAFYDVETLRLWKNLAERTAAKELERGGNQDSSLDRIFVKLEQVMPELLEEMRQDLVSTPLRREFILVSKHWVYNSDPNHPCLAYYFEDHPDLKDKIRVLENYGLVENITYNSIDRYIFREALVAYLIS